MFDDPHKRTFFSAPQSVQSLIAAFLEPGITVLTFVVATLAGGDFMDRPALTLCLLVFALTFPGRDRFREPLLGAAVDIGSSWLVLLSILALCAYATRSFHYFENNILLAWAAITPVLQWLATWLGRTVVRRNAAKSRRTAVVVGASALGVKVARALQGGDNAGVEFAGFFDDRGDGRIDGDAKTQVLGKLSEVAAYTTEHGVREVYITLPLGSQPRIVELLEQLQSTTASLFFVPDVFGISIIQGRLQDMNGVPVVGICETPFTGTNELVKRISDVVIASIIIVLIAPLLLAIAIGVKLSSPGPVLFKQRRNGLDGHEIVVYKFRSMRTMEDGEVVRQATRNDPRVTPFGAFLRRTSFDELPQFFNVLRGTMSIVGPRPHAVTHNKEYRQIIKAYMVRHKVKPGITGWAQVNGQRGETDTVEKMRARVEYDLEYLRNWSLGLDLKIIVATVRVLFFDRHAYKGHWRARRANSEVHGETMKDDRSKRRTGSVLSATCGMAVCLATTPALAQDAPKTAAGSAASDPNPYYVGVGQGFTHESNVYRIPSGPGDTYSSTSIFGGFDQPISRQRIFGRGTVSWNRYQDETSLNNTSYDLSVGADLATVENISGNLNFGLSQNLSAPSATNAAPAAIRNVAQTERAEARLRWGGASLLTLEGSLGYVRVDNSSPRYVASNSHKTTTSLGLFYRPGDFLRVGVAGRLERSETPNAVFDPVTGSSRSNSGDGRNLDLLADYTVSALLRANGRLSYTRHTNSAIPGADFSGVTGSLDVNWQPTGKIAASFSVSRDAGFQTSTVTGYAATQTGTGVALTPVSALYENNQVTDAVGVAATYAATAKISAGARLRYSRAKLFSAVPTAAGLKSVDVAKAAGFSLNYAITRAWSANCSYSYEDRDVSGAATYSYTVNTIGCATQFTWK